MFADSVRLHIAALLCNSKSLVAVVIKRHSATSDMFGFSGLISSAKYPITLELDKNGTSEKPIVRNQDTFAFKFTFVAFSPSVTSP